MIKENKLLFKVDLMKQLLTTAYETKDEDEMIEKINEIIELREATENKHFQWFESLLLNHLEGIIAHATIRISSGK